MGRSLENRFVRCSEYSGRTSFTSAHRTRGPWFLENAAVHLCPSGQGSIWLGQGYCLCPWYREICSYCYGRDWALWRFTKNFLQIRLKAHLQPYGCKCAFGFGGLGGVVIYFSFSYFLVRFPRSVCLMTPAMTLIRKPKSTKPTKRATMATALPAGECTVSDTRPPPRISEIAQTEPESAPLNVCGSTACASVPTTTIAETRVAR